MAAAAESLHQEGPAAPVEKVEGPEMPLVGEVCGRRLTVVVRRTDSMTDVADSLLFNDRTAAIVLDHQTAAAAVTENDIVQAYLTDMDWHTPVETWLHSELARAPAALLGKLTLRPSATILDAAAHLRQQGQTDKAHSCRHCVVLEEGEAKPRAILSAMDLVQAMVGLPASSLLGSRFRAKTVGEVMKPRSVLPVVLRNATLQQAVQEMAASGQNCVLVALPEASSPGTWPGLQPLDEPMGDMLGLVTPRDALRAFAEHIPGVSRVDSWLHGLQESWRPRTVLESATIAEAAALLAEHKVHHLVVISEGDSPLVVGVLSATDLAYELGSEEYQTGPISAPVGGA